MNVSACLVTRGDVDMQPIIDSLPDEWEVVVWDNGAGYASISRAPRSDWDAPFVLIEGKPNLAVYGRYAAIEYSSHDLIYVQDDDVIVSDPQAIVQAWCGGPNVETADGFTPPSSFVACNMPQEFRPHYPDSGLVGFGAAFHRDAPQRAFERFWQGVGPANHAPGPFPAPFLRRADNVFTALTPRVLVDVPKTDLPYASDDNRMWRQDSHVGERDRFIELARGVRDA